ncbi:hypothetical protein ACFVTJ_06375 [Agrobacterium sp. NPDC058088]|uniref:hypothetical protein n=1 Tax=Agrobacterium sp. NPDC058088 TaxID=3346335 RepID=UPI0036DF09E1
MFRRGRDLFEISRRKDALPAAVTTAPDSRTLSHFFISEEWSGELSSGVIRLGEHTSFMHGLPPGECGLLNLVRCYDRGDHARVLELFEKVSAEPSRFCFSTSVSILPAMRQPVICMGESSGFEDGQQGRISGLFLFPRFEDIRFAA